MPVTVLYISQGLRTKALEPKWLRFPHGLAAEREIKCLCALHKADEPSCRRGGGCRQVSSPYKMTLHKAPLAGGGTLWLCQAVGDLPSACPSLFPRFLLEDSYYNH